MQLTDFLDSLRSIIFSIAKFLRNLAQRHTLLLMASILFVAILLSVWSVYRDFMIQEHTFLVGPRGSTSFRDARKIAEAIEDQSRWYGTEYRVQLETTDGYEENRQRISGDVKGTSIGFAHDGFQSGENVRVLLPLKTGHLHVLLSRSAWFEHQNTEAESFSKSLVFPDIIPLIEANPGRIYLGPLDSGTRQVASQVLKHHGLDPGRASAHGVANWHEMRAALNSGELAVAFYNGPKNADVVSRIAQDESCVLVGLGSSAKAIHQGNGHLIPRKFEANSYVHEGFCPTEIVSLASRQVLICSDNMSDADAFFLTTHAYSALRDNMPELNWGTPYEPRESDIPLTYQVHSGTERWRQEKPMSWLPWNFNIVLLTIVVWGAAELARFLKERLDARLQPPTDQDREGYQSLKTTVDKFIGVLERKPLIMPSEEQADWESKTNSLRTSVIEATEQNTISQEQSHSLFGGIRELEHELNLRKSQESTPEVEVATDNPS